MDKQYDKREEKDRQMMDRKKKSCLVGKNTFSNLKKIFFHFCLRLLERMVRMRETLLFPFAMKG